MDIQRLITLFITMALFSLFIKVINKQAIRRLEKESIYSFTLRMNRGFAWYFTLVFFWLIIMFPLVLRGVDLHIGGYFLIGAMLLFCFVFMLRGHVKRLKVNGDDFTFVTTFGKTTKFTIEEITKATHEKGILEKKDDDKMRLYIGTKVIRLDSMMLGFELLLKRLREEGVFERRLLNLSATADKILESIKSDEDKWNESVNSARVEDILNEIIDINRRYIFKNVLMFDEIPILNLKEAKISYVEKTENNEIPILLYNDSHKELAKEGFLLTSIHFSWKSSLEKANRLSVFSIEGFSFKRGKVIKELIVEVNGEHMEIEVGNLVEKFEEDAFISMLNLMLELVKILHKH